MYKLVKVTLLFVLVTVLSLGFTFPVSAATTGPTFSNPVPADGKILTAGSHLMEIEVSDPDMINAASVEMLINGQKVSASTDYVILEVDPVSETETYDYSRAIISYRQTFPDNTYNVEVRAKDGSGNLSVKNWSFEVKSGPVFSSLKPSPYSTVYSRFPRVSALVSVPAGRIDPSGVEMKINGEQVPVFFDVFTSQTIYLGGFTGEAIYTPLNSLTPGKYTVNLTATDTNGKSSSTSWTFSVDYPVMPVSAEKQDCLKCHTNMPAQHKMSNCTACHDSALRKIYENISPTPHFVASNCFSCHDTVSHEAAATADKPAWYPIDQYYSCEQCHSHSSESVLAKHQSSTTGNCQECHSMGLTQEHFKNGRVDESGDSITCFTCHNSSNTSVKNAIASNNTTCEACHTTVTHTAVHNNPVFTALTKDSDMDCAGCHKSSISDEHTNGRFTSSQGITCDSCHNSSRPEVKAAIAANNLNCEACHIDPVTNVPKVHTSSGPPLHDSIFVVSQESDCIQCHANNLKTVHVGQPNKLDNNYPMSCATCHESSNPAILTAINAKNTNCDACHTTRHNGISHSFPAGYVLSNPTNMNCAGCHQGSSLTDFHVGKVSDSGATMSCNTCHGTAAPDNVKTAISSGQTNCDACHVIHQDSAQAHNNPAFTALPVQPDMNCSGCHNSSISDEHISGKLTSGKGYTCSTCHDSSRPEVKAAIAANNLNCEACHIDPVTNVPKVHTSSGPPLHDSIFVVSQESDCIQCHANNLKTVHVGQPNKLDNNYPMSCATCHESSNPAVLTAVNAKNTNCDACHTTRHNGISHSFPAGYVLSNPTNMNCAGCHQGSSLTDFHVGKPSNSGTMSCNTCHGTAAPDSVKTAITSGQTNCDACHVIHQDSAQAHSNPAYTALPVQPDMNCSDCHNSSISDEHISGKMTSGKGYTCSTCHDSTRTEVKAAIAASNLNCDACHSSVHTSPNPYHVTTFVTNKTMACEKCHDSGSIADEHAKYNTSAGQAIICQTCHNSTDDKVKTAIISGNTGCDSCHISRHSDVQAPHKTTYIPDATYNCINCHSAASIGYNQTASFHRISGLTPDVNTLHGGLFVGSWTATSNVECRGCHGPNPYNNTYYGKLLKGSYTASTGKLNFSGTTELCFLCHSKYFYTGGQTFYSGSGFKTSTGLNLHTKSHNYLGCQSCHSRKPHSNTQQHFITSRSAAEPYSLIYRFEHSNTYTYENSCSFNCHSQL